MAWKSSWEIGGFPNVAGSIGEKVAKKWLEREGYKVYYFQDIMGMFAYSDIAMRRMNRTRNAERRKEDKHLIQRTERILMDVFGQEFEAGKKFDGAIRELAGKEEETRLAHGYKKRRAIGFDFIASKGDKIFFIEVKVNQAKVGKYQKLTSNIAKEHGFRAMVLRLNVEIEVGKSIQLVECTQLCGEASG